MGKMSTSSSRRHEKKVHDHDEESAARTRPLGYEEIMLRRKDKKLCDNVVAEAVDLGDVLGEGSTENVSEAFESKRGERRHKDLAPVVEKPLSEERVKESSRKKETDSSKSTKTEDNVVKGKVRRSNESESLKDKPKKDTRSEARGDKTDKQVHGRRKIEDSIDESVKKQSRDYSTRKERHLDQNRGEHERETKRKYQHENDDKIRDRSAAKKHDSGKLRSLEISERKERTESSKSRFEESRRKRGRSRSRDRVDRHRLSSRSPRAHKHTLNNLGPRSDISSYSPKDRSGRQHLDIDSSRVSTNGSSSHYQRHGESANRLGGYSPRKRRTESAIKTPSPPDRSPEKKNARWDLPHASTDKALSSLVASHFQSSNSNVSSNVHGMTIAVAVASTTTTSIPGVSPNSILTKKNASVDSVQLTQATRRMRRLHVENIPSTTSENTLVESLNKFLLSSGVNHIQGTQPCISCVINKEKGQALVEFLTPQDALAALSFDGSSFFGSILKIRRPKDFVDVATGDPEKSVAAAESIETISDVVNDSPNKIFIGGISKALSSEMLLEIVSVFGPLKAYHFEANEELNEACAFLEYVDQSVTLKACAGLNGIKLGGRVLTVVQAIHSGSSMVNSGNASLYEIPEHAKPLLKQPSHILKLRNVFNLEHMSSLSEQEIEEVLEDVRLECARFGMVKSVKIVKHANNHIVTTRACEAVNDAESGGHWQNLCSEEKAAKTETLDEHIDNDGKETSGVKLTGELKEDEVPESNCFGYDKPAGDFVEDKSCQMGQPDKDIEVQGSNDLPNRDPEELTNLPNSMKDASECYDDKTPEVTTVESSIIEEVDGKKQQTFAGTDDNVGTETDSILESGTKEQHNGKENDFDLGSIFEPGCVFVEFGRSEASWMAAHCLHGRVFEDRIVTVEYIAPDHYRAKFLN
ncbi:splicing factor U2af large subunit A [Rosa rugosa]|uniref:splicing factor U2af large subunit A n=1 Tax=Rosa rugosa TaxID=74645 RepID=UPI002B410FED|nr:splicing factor U2af large subunit A [Rosa rugosa]XP_061990336.1 splicing factor U2af large subunit A [Rosa rugosa]